MSNVLYFRQRWYKDIDDSYFKLILVLGNQILKRLNGGRQEVDVNQIRHDFIDFDKLYLPFAARTDAGTFKLPVETDQNWRLFVVDNVFRFREVWGPVIGKELFNIMVNVVLTVKTNIASFINGGETEPFELLRCLTPKI